MTKQLWIYCFLVSAVLAALMPIATSTVLVPSEGEEVLDLESISPSQLENMPPEDLGDFVDTLPTRKVEGFERFTYQFTHPQFMHFYLPSVAVSFVWLLIATVAVSYLSHRGTMSYQR
jgi:hypothetical protein